MMLTYTSRRVVAIEGNQQGLSESLTMKQIGDLIAADCCSVIMLKHGMVMIVDDAGQEKKLPINYLATAIVYGSQPYGLEREIRGDVVIAPDTDFEAVHG